MEQESAGKNFSVKEILTDFVLPQLTKIDAKLDSKAEATAVNELRIRMETLEKTFVTRDEKHKMESAIAGLQLKIEPLPDIKTDVEGLKSWRNRFAGALALVVVLLPVVAVLASSHPHVL